MFLVSKAMLTESKLGKNTLCCTVNTFVLGSREDCGDVGASVKSVGVAVGITVGLRDREGCSNSSVGVSVGVAVGEGVTVGLRVCEGCCN